MDWTKGYTATWHLYAVDRGTWADGSEIASFTSAEVQNDTDGDSPLLQSGTVSFESDAPSAEFYARIAMVARQGDEVERVDIATLLCSANDGENHESDGRSVLYPASVNLLPFGTCCNAGIDAVSWVQRLLANVVNCPVESTGEAVLREPIVCDLGSSVLDAAWTVLKAVNFTMAIDGDGTVRIMPLPSEPTITLDSSLIGSVIADSIDRQTSWLDVPNRYRAIDGLQVAEVVNDSIDSIVSTSTRGYFVDVVEQSPNLIGGETLLQYAERKLHEMSTVPHTVSYEREWVPGANLFGIVHVTDERFGEIGDYRITSQHMAIGAGVTVSETVEMEVSLW